MGTGKGKITRTPNRRMRVLLSLQIAWLFMACLLGLWWGHLVLKQAGYIAELERKTGMSDNLIMLGWLKTQRMLYWESGSFFVILLASLALLIGLYWRDTRRARSIQAFFASVTHELKTPLTSIRLQAESISDALPVDHEVRGLTQRMMEDTSRLETQVERMLELARVEGGGPVYTQAVNLKQLVDRFIKAWLPSYRQKLEIKNEIENCEVLADPTAVQVILRNLLDNSLRHATREDISIHLRTLNSSGRVELVFQDNGGKGVSAKNIPSIPNKERLGKLFEKGSASQGTGVGLYLVRTLMERMGGEAVFWGVTQLELGNSAPDALSGFKVSLRFLKGDEGGRNG